MNILTKGDIFNAVDSRIEEVDLTEYWGGSVFIKNLTGSERDVYEMSILEGKGDDDKINLKNARIDLVIMTTYGDSECKELLFTSEDKEKLNEKSARPLNKIFAVSQRLSGLRKEDIEELTKN